MNIRLARRPTDPREPPISETRPPPLVTPILTSLARRGNAGKRTRPQTTALIPSATGNRLRSR
ncbi:hypothetical protein T484DRAFT_1936378 [Baffinella frigidus]|nr:hypothetical protein T484DRAFT_1936378 [Cryptophyta sp. CCMP2293]